MDIATEEAFEDSVYDPATGERFPVRPALPSPCLVRVAFAPAPARVAGPSAESARRCSSSWCWPRSWSRCPWA